MFSSYNLNFSKDILKKYLSLNLAEHSEKPIRDTWNTFWRSRHATLNPQTAELTIVKNIENIGTFQTKQGILYPIPKVSQFFTSFQPLMFFWPQPQPFNHRPL